MASFRNPPLLARKARPGGEPHFIPRQNSIRSHRLPAWKPSIPLARSCRGRVARLPYRRCNRSTAALGPRTFHRSHPATRLTFRARRSLGGCVTQHAPELPDCFRTPPPSSALARPASPALAKQDDKAALRPIGGRCLLPAPYGRTRMVV